MRKRARAFFSSIACISMLIIPSILSVWGNYPPAGSDYMPSTTATIELTVPAMFDETLVVKGPTTIARGDHYDPGDGRIKIDTEIVSMNLVGTSVYIGPITVVESPTVDSNGTVRQQTAGIDFPADSFFDVFIEIQTMLPFPNNVLHNDDPVFMNATIGTIPPWNTTYTGRLESVELKDQNGMVIGFISHVSHETGPDPWYYKHWYTDYAPSGVPDFDQRQGGTYQWMDPWGAWSHCGPVAVANSLWWLDSEFDASQTPPPMINDGFPLVQTYVGAGWDDHDPRNVPWLVEHLAYLMDTDGRRTGLTHSGTDVNDMEAGLAQYLSWTGVNPAGDVNGDGVVDQTDGNIIAPAFGSSPGMANWNLAADIWPASIGYPPVADNVVNVYDQILWATNFGRTGLFYEHTVMQPDFFFIEEEVKKCQDVVLLVGYWIFDGEGWYREPGGHYVTVAGVDSTEMKLALSDPVQDAFESGLIPEGRIPVPHVHPPPEPPYTTHNDAQYVSQDIYSVAQISPPWLPPCPGGNWMIANFASWRPAPPFFAVIESAVVTSPSERDLAVTAITTSKQGCIPAPTIGRNYTLQINVTVENHGEYVESFFDVWVECSLGMPPPITIGPIEVASLGINETVTLTFNWNTTGVAFGNYTLTGVVETVPGETDTADNNYPDGSITVSIIGDINGDFKVSLQDLVLLANAYGSSLDTAKWSPNADINGDGKVSLADLVLMANHYGQHYP